MRNAKAGAWWEEAAQRAMANNSAVYTGGYSVLMSRVRQHSSKATLLQWCPTSPS